MTIKVDMPAYYMRMAEWHAEHDPGAWGRHVFFYLLAAQFEIDCKSDPSLQTYPKNHKRGILDHDAARRKQNYGS